MLCSAGAMLRWKWLVGKEGAFPLQLKCGALVSPSHPEPKQAPGAISIWALPRAGLANSREAADLPWGGEMHQEPACGVCSSAACAGGEENQLLPWVAPRPLLSGIS